LPDGRPRSSPGPPTPSQGGTVNPVRAARQRHLQQLRKRVTAYRQEVAAHCAAHGRPGPAAILDDRYLAELLQGDEPARDVALWACRRDRVRAMLRLTASAGPATTRRRAPDRRAARGPLTRIAH